jgi:hypothetical protein
MKRASSATEGSRLGRRFANALARRDFGELAAVLHPEIQLRALTPRRVWEPDSHRDALDVLQTWFGNCDIQRVTRLETDAIANRQRVTYRFRGRRPDGPFVIEQQVYFCERDGQIDWMRIMCSGFQAPPSSEHSRGGRG